MMNYIRFFLLFFILQTSIIISQNLDSLISVADSIEQDGFWSLDSSSVAMTIIVYESIIGIDKDNYNSNLKVLHQ